MTIDREKLKAPVTLPDVGARPTKRVLAIMRAFNAAIDREMERRGATIAHEITLDDPKELDYRRWQIQTRAGKLEVSAHGDWVACRFESPERAAPIVGTHNLNPYSGKWNHNYWGHYFDHAVADFVRALDMVGAGEGGAP